MFIIYFECIQVCLGNVTISNVILCISIKLAFEIILNIAKITVK